MMKEFGGEVLFLDRSDINTDEIIPAKYLTEISKQALKPYLLEDLKLDGFNPKTDIAGKKVIITRENFGCGSSREHAPWALEVNGIYAVVAVNFARIFRQNMYNCGMLAIDMDKKSVDDMFHTFGDKDVECKIVFNDDGTAKVKLIAGSLSKSYPFKCEGFEKALIENDGWIGLADKKY
jgi:3-isopropylmalate/(R)-2-methylmalate dehydratase small subunit